MLVARACSSIELPKKYVSFVQVMRYRADSKGNFVVKVERNLKTSDRDQVFSKLFLLFVKKIEK